MESTNHQKSTSRVGIKGQPRPTGNPTVSPNAPSALKSNIGKFSFNFSKLESYRAEKHFSPSKKTPNSYGGFSIDPKIRYLNKKNRSWRPKDSLTFNHAFGPIRLLKSFPFTCNIWCIVLFYIDRVYFPEVKSSSSAIYFSSLVSQDQHWRAHNKDTPPKAMTMTSSLH